MEEFIQTWLFDPTTGKIILTVAGIAVIVAVVKFLKRSIGHYIRDTDTRYRVRKLIAFAGYLVAFFFLTVVFSDRLGKLGVAFGIAGAGIAFSLQEVIASFAGWLALSFGSFYRTGDRILLGGIRGDVIDIGILRTTLMEIGDWVKGDLYNGRIVRVANSFVFKEPVYNYSADFPFLWDEIRLPVRYGSDRELTRAILDRVVHEVVGDYIEFAKVRWKEMVEKYRIEDARVDPMIIMTANDNWMEYVLRYVVDYKKRMATKDRLFNRILDEIEQTDGKVRLSSATAEIFLGDNPVLDVRIREQKRDVSQ